MPTKAASSGKDAPESKYRAPALEKGLDILELMARHSHPIKASQMAETLGRSLSELFRMIQVLEYRGFIGLSDNKEGYVLTNKLFTLGMSQPPIQSLVQAALPVMNELALKTSQSCHLVVASDDQIVVIARVESTSDIGFAVRLGYRRGVRDTTSGPVLFAFQPENRKAEWLERLEKSEGKRPIAKFVEMAEEIAGRGYAKAHSDFIEGVTDLTAPIMGKSGAEATITIPYVYYRPVICPINVAAEHLIAAAHQISAGYQGTMPIA
ncbi:IclR family transcriptional regulator [Parvularcula flava]|uniref:Transcriptional regulator n=1 Tax=Aquisalinus luteolus TaxID=1566827 RepID=A0A8J3A4J8_9PROT|nr:IclR family transcriptional regulator [Aquisalinus luteolus]NHK26473.1 IclR family transcriptional regulator [Aquisalinus luteolus]GGH92439.1 transcriptional regulator [Aquisalinus luteolus]